MLGDMGWGNRWWRNRRQRNEREREGARYMDRRIIMGKVVEEWKEMEGKRRGGRKTGEG